MTKSRIAVAGALLAVAGAASAGSFSVTPAIVSDYDFRGFTQTDEDAAFQLGGTYEFDNGFYVGAWGSNVDFGTDKPDIEIDYYAGFAAETDLFGYDVGLQYYSYPSAGSSNTLEIYGGISKEWFSSKLWYSPDYASTDESGFYLEANADYPLPVGGLSLIGHLGYTFGDIVNGDEFLDYAVGLGFTLGNFQLGAKYVNSNDAGVGPVGRSAYVFSLQTTLPWSAE